MSYYSYCCCNGGLPPLPPPPPPPSSSLSSSLSSLSSSVSSSRSSSFSEIQACDFCDALPRKYEMEVAYNCEATDGFGNPAVCVAGPPVGCCAAHHYGTFVFKYKRVLATRPLVPFRIFSAPYCTVEYEVDDRIKVNSLFGPCNDAQDSPMFRLWLTKTPTTYEAVVVGVSGPRNGTDGNPSVWIRQYTSGFQCLGPLEDLVLTRMSPVNSGNCWQNAGNVILIPGFPVWQHSVPRVTLNPI